VAAGTRGASAEHRGAAVVAGGPGGEVCALEGGRLLEAWERGTVQDDLDRALTLLAAAWPDAAPEALARLSIPVRNRELLRLRWISFGPTLAGLTACGACGARLEFSVPIPAVLDRLERLGAGDSVAWVDGGAACTLRAATTDDLRAAVLEPDDGEARRCLLARCLSVRGSGADTEALVVVRSDPRTLARFDHLHEGAEIMCEVLCPQCTAVDVVDLDIARFVWDEVRHAALRLLREVHALASAYGWSEEAIAALTTQRRRAYLEMVWA